MNAATKNPIMKDFYYKHILLSMFTQNLFAISQPGHLDTIKALKCKVSPYASF